jgi:4-hydroxysphinganine ceramide fatty acyl 2-hydroxylase
LIIGYFVYCTFHHVQHHYSIANTWFRGLTKHHNIHHSLRDVNFGVTNRFWDHVFGTIYRKEDYKAKTVTRAPGQ